MIKRFAFLVVMISSLAAQSVAVTFEDGLDYYNRGAYWEALRIFSELADQNISMNKQLSASHYMRIRCYYKLGFFQRALTLAHSFSEDFPKSAYGDDIDFVLGELYMAIREPREAAWHFAKAAASTEDRKVRKTAREYAYSLIMDACDERDLVALSSRSIDRTGQFVSLLVAERYMKEGSDDRALDILFNVRPFIHDNDLVKRAITIYQRFSQMKNDTLHVAVLLPLSGNLSFIGEKILDGIRYAGMQTMDTTDLEIQLHIFDNQGKLAETIRCARKIAELPYVHAVVGPLTNDNVKGASAILGGSGIPLIAPAATENNLTALAKEIFQPRSTRERKSIALAEYAINVLHLKTFAIIAPSTEYGQQLADNFASRIDELGGEILYQGWYVGEPTDLSKLHFRRIREIGIEDLFNRMEADTLVDSSLNDLTQEVMKDSINIYEEMLRPILDKDRPTYSDSLRIELSHIDGIYFPIQKGSIPYIASQFAHNNLDAYVFGDENWLDKKALNNNHRYLPKLTIAVGDRMGIEDIRKEFSDEYLQMYLRQPDQYDYLGYDVMSLLLTAVQLSGPSHNALWTTMIQMPTFDGMIHKIQWGGKTRRENDLVFLLNYKDKSFQLAGYYDHSGFFSADSDSVATE